MTETDTRNGALGGQIGSPSGADTTFHGSDPETVAAASICIDTSTRCQARTRLYSGGQLIDQGFAVERISDHLSDSGTTVWLDLRDPEQEDLAAIRPDLNGNEIMAELGLAPGPEIGKAYRHLLELRMERGPMTREDAVAALHEWAAEQLGR